MAKVKKKSKVLAVSQPTTIIKKKNVVSVDKKIKKKKSALGVQKVEPVKLTSKDMKAFDTQNAKAAKLMEDKKYDNEFRRKAGLPLHRGGKGLSKEEKAAREAAKAAKPKRGRGRPKKIRTPEEIAEMERIAAEKKARGRGRPRKHPLPTPEEIAAKEARKAERERKKKEKERLMKKREMKRAEVIKKSASLSKGIKSFAVTSGSSNGSSKGRSKADKEKGKKALAKYEDVMTTFQQEFGDLKKMFGAEAEDFQNDKSSIAMLRSMVAMTMDMLPIAEQAYRKAPNNFNASALVNLSNQARELANDIRNLQSLEQQIEHIGTEIIMPGTRMMAENLVSEIFKLKKEISFYIKKASVRRILLGHIETLGYSQGKFMTRTTMEMREKVRKYLLE